MKGFEKWREDERQRNFTVIRTYEESASCQEYQRRERLKVRLCAPTASSGWTDAAFERIVELMFNSLRQRRWRARQCNTFVLPVQPASNSSPPLTQG